MYYLVLDEQKAGPFTLEQIRQGWKDGTYTPDTLFWQEGMTEWQPLRTMQSPIESPAETPAAEDAPPAMIIGGFWRRLGAFLLDVLLIGIVGFGSGYFLFEFYMTLGIGGLLIGLVVATAYFGILNSRIGGGQTLGKRLLGIRVVDANGDLIPPGRSILRYLILALPFFLNKAVTNGIVSNLSSASLLMIPVMAGFIALTYLLIFNRRTRQLVHDLAVRTYVVRVTSPRPTVAPTLWHGHGIVVAVLCILIVGLGALFPLVLRMPYFLHMLNVREAILATGQAQTATVTGGTTVAAVNGQVSSTRVYSVMARVKGHPVSSEAMAIHFADLAIKSDASTPTYNYLNISISYGYDIGIASGSVTDIYSHTVDEWKQLVAHATPPQ